MEVSFKGIGSGLAFSVVASMILGLVSGYVLASVLGSGEAAMEMVRPSGGSFSPIAFFLAAVVAVVSGYVAARVAGRGELINGALANAIHPALRVVISIGSDELAINLVYLVILPLFGMLGGYIRLKQVAEYA